MKPRRCTICRKPATQGNAVNAWCSHEHAIELIERNRAKQAKRQAKIERATTRKAKEAAKGRATLKAEAQAAVNAFVRARDAGKPCISCGRPDDGQHQRHAGHWKTTKARPDIRFDPANIHAQCYQCNVHGGGGIHPGYLPELTARIGNLEVDRLTRVQTIKHTDDDLRHIRDTYRKAARELLRRAA